jgi:serine phosphatase RsbU (regulator of sigma subunit)
MKLYKKLKDFLIENRTDNEKLYLIVNASLLTIIFSIFYVGLCALMEFWSGLYVMTFNAIGYLVVLGLLRTNVSLNIIGNLYVGIGGLAISLVIYFDGGMNATILPWLTAIPTLALLVMGQKYAKYWVVITLIVTILFIVLSVIGYNPSKEYSNSWQLFFSSSSLIGLILIVYFISLVFQNSITQAMSYINYQKEQILNTNEELNQLNEELNSNIEVVQDKNKVIEKQNDEVKASILYASRIQNALLPVDKNIKGYFKDECFIINKPRDIVSGDFYWFEKLEDCAIIVAADCTGHGVPGAFMSMLGVTGLNSIVFQEGIFRADKILNHLHDYIYKSLQQDQGKSSDGMDVSVLVVYDSIPIAEFAGAMNSIYCIQNNELREIKADKKPIGSNHYGKDREYTKQVIDISKPTTFYMGSDGYQDQFGGKNNKKFMKKNLKKLALEQHSQSFSKQKEIFTSTLENWIKEGEEHQIDDVLLMGFKVDRNPKNLKD